MILCFYSIQEIDSYVNHYSGILQDFLLVGSTTVFRIVPKLRSKTKISNLLPGLRNCVRLGYLPIDKKNGKQFQLSQVKYNNIKTRNIQYQHRWHLHLLQQPWSRFSLWGSRQWTSMMHLSANNERYKLYICIKKAGAGFVSEKCNRAKCFHIWD